MLETLVIGNERAESLLWLDYTKHEILLKPFSLISNFNHFTSSPSIYLQIFIKNKYPRQVLWHHTLLLLSLSFFVNVYIFCLHINDAGWISLSLVKNIWKIIDFYFSINIFAVKLFLTVLNKNSNLTQKAHLLQNTHLQAQW